MGFGPIQEIPEEDKVEIEEVKVVRDANRGVDVVPVNRTIDMDNPNSGSDHLDNMAKKAEKYETLQGIEKVPKMMVAVEVSGIITLEDDAVDLIPITIEIDSNNQVNDSIIDMQDDYVSSVYHK